MGAAALGCSDSGGRCTSRGHDRRTRTREAAGAGAAANKWSTTMRGGGQQLGAGGRGSAARC
jgi:hypothetical protein